MAKCTRCGRKGFFLKLTNGLCDNCVSTMRMEQEQAALKAQMEEISAKLSDQKALFERISADAYADGVAKAKAKNAELTTQNLQIEERILAGKKNLVELSEKRKRAARVQQMRNRRCAVAKNSSKQSSTQMKLLAQMIRRSATLKSF